MIRIFHDIDPSISIKIRESYHPNKNTNKKVRTDLRNLAYLNIKHWIKDSKITLEQFSQLNPDSFHILDELGEWFLLFEVCNKKLSCYMHQAEAGSLRHTRARLYNTFFSEILSINNDILKISFRFLVYIKDVSPNVVSNYKYSSIPFFCFQKQVWSNGIAIPDIDLLENHWYETINDKTEFSKKINKATFSGSTTGINDNSGLTGVNYDSISRLTLPRIRAAEYLEQSDNVIFKLPNLVQYKSNSIRNNLEIRSYTHARLSIEESLMYKFLISIDGNGANCSRVAIGLKSNCVLIKYESVIELYYFKVMQKMVHYVPVNAEYQISDICNLEGCNDGLFTHISIEGKRFFNNYLSTQSSCEYLEEILRLYCLTATSSTSE